MSLANRHFAGKLNYKDVLVNKSINLHNSLFWWADDTFYFGTVEGQRNGTEKLNTLKMWVGLEVVSEDPLQFNGTLTAYEDRDGTVFLQQNLVLDTDYDNYAIFYRCVTHVSNVSISRIMFKIHKIFY